MPERALRARCERAWRDMRRAMGVPDRRPPAPDVGGGALGAFLDRADVRRVVQAPDVGTDWQREAVAAAADECARHLSLDAHHRDLGATYHEIERAKPQLPSKLLAGKAPLDPNEGRVATYYGSDSD